MKTAMQEVLEMINNRASNKVKTKLSEEEIDFWLEKEKKQTVKFAVWFNHNDNAYKSYEEIVDTYFKQKFTK